MILRRRQSDGNVKNRIAIWMYHLEAMRFLVSDCAGLRHEADELLNGF